MCHCQRTAFVQLVLLIVAAVLTSAQNITNTTTRTLTNTTTTTATATLTNTRTTTGTVTNSTTRTTTLAPTTTLPINPGGNCRNFNSDSSGCINYPYYDCTYCSNTLTCSNQTSSSSSCYTLSKYCMRGDPFCTTTSNCGYCTSTLTCMYSPTGTRPSQCTSATGGSGSWSSPTNFANIAGNIAGAFALGIGILLVIILLPGIIFLIVVACLIYHLCIKTPPPPVQMQMQMPMVMVPQGQATVVGIPQGGYPGQQPGYGQQYGQQPQYGQPQQAYAQQPQQAYPMQQGMQAYPVPMQKGNLDRL